MLRIEEDMKLTIKTIKEKFKFLTKDNKEFSIDDALFDDKYFNIDYFICSYGGLLDAHRVLVSPQLIRDIDIMTKTINLDLDSEHLKDGPTPDYKVPVSREYKRAYVNYPVHPYFFGMGGSSVVLEEQIKAYQLERSKEVTQGIDRPNHTRAINEVEKYKFITQDSKSGDISDWIIETETWSLCGFIATFGSFINTESYLVPTHTIEKVSFLDNKISLNINQKDITVKVNFDPNKQINLNREITGYDYYGRSQDSQSL
jgi:hypothetical protein